MNKTITITRVLSTAEPYHGVSKNNGKAYTVHKWTCELEIDGRPVGPIDVETLSGKVAAEVRDGWSGEAKEDNYNGKVSWKLETPRQEGFGGGNSGGYSRGGSVSASKQDVIALLDVAMAEGCRLAQGLEANVGALTPAERTDAAIRLGATAMIALQKAGAKA